mmetsp:Transcript_43867/g.74882  ORF Transcript_43867/g.74882 Transcript_43867/m.74882 type:complete len:216 (+) Transcript_43867:241-888(+)
MPSNPFDLWDRLCGKSKTATDVADEASDSKTENVDAPVTSDSKTEKVDESATSNSTTEKADAETDNKGLTAEQVADYENLQYLATKREIQCTIRKSTKAGLAAGISVMAGTLVAGPAGSVAGGAVGTALAAKISKDVVPLNKLLEETPPAKRGEVLKLYNEAFKEEFMDTIQNSPELKLLVSSHSPLSIVRYMVDRDLIKSEKLKKLDGILKKVK